MFNLKVNGKSTLLVVFIILSLTFSAAITQTNAAQASSSVDVEPTEDPTSVIENIDEPLFEHVNVFHKSEEAEDKAIEDELSREEHDFVIHQKEHNKTLIRQHFNKPCPLGFFECTNGECISPKWRCDGSYDCDDMSDELNCQLAPEISPKSVDIPKINNRPHSSTSTTPKPPAIIFDDPDLKFQSPDEPLMLFSTGVAVRGFWMKSRLYFDVFTIPGFQTSNVRLPAQPSGLTDLFRTFFPETREAEARVKAGKSTIVGLDLDPTFKEVYWVETGAQSGVYSTVIDDDQFSLRHKRKQSDIITVVDTGLKQPEDVSIDRVGRNLYISDGGWPAIIVCSIKHSQCRMIAHKRHNLHKPRALVADSTTGWVLYTDWGDEPGIFMLSMDGSHHEAFITTDIVWPNGIVMDPSSDQLYWADARLNKIERVDMHTRERSIVLREEHAAPFSLSAFEDRLYWSDWNGNDIRSCDKRFGNHTITILSSKNLYGIHIYHPDLYPNIGRSNPCWSKRCSHLCLLSPKRGSFSMRRPGAVTASCACPNSLHLSLSDGATCIHPSFATPADIAASVAKEAAVVTIHNPSTTEPSRVRPSGVSSASSARPSDSSKADQPHMSLATPTTSTTTSTTSTTTTTTTTTALPELSSAEAAAASASHMHDGVSRLSEDHLTESAASNGMAWLIVLLLILSVTGLVTLVSLLILYRQGRLPKQVSQLSVSFISSRGHEKDGAMLLLDNDS